MTIDELLAERQKTHGCWEDHASITQELKERAQNSSGWHFMSYSAREALDMILHKIGRIVAGQETWQHEDHWADIAGYATLAQRELQQAPEPASESGELNDSGRKL